MAKIKLGQRPKSFKRIVSFPLVDDTTGQIEMVFKYKTRSEFGEFIDNILNDAGQAKSNGEFSMKDLMEKTADSNADYILKIAEGWNLDEEFTRANLQQLSDEIPAATAAIMETYRLAISEGRSGN
jgi:hypothetical protein